ncbi:MAG: InlB B-repeat-containing protein, partial [Clostridia bacterium]|nr:InlB B-repeat-containing protein [Clostridia bacterium]
LKEGFSIVQGENKYVVNEDVSLVIEGMKEIDITEGIAINGWWSTGDAQELTYTTINFPEGVLPGIIAYSAMDKAAWMNLQEYIALNGKTVKEINETTDTSDYVFSTFPSNADDKYKVPVIIFENGNNLEIKFHNTYLKTLGNQLEITVKAGLSIVVGNTKYVVGSDVTQTVLEIVEEDISGNVSVSGWYAAGDAQELTYTRIQFPKGVLPESLDYDVTDKAAWTYLQEYIYLNGKSIKEINETTDTSAYVFSTFPSTADAKYKLPVIIYESNNGLELKFHNTYLQTVEGDLEITIKEGLYVTVGATKYIVNEDVCYQLSDEIWADKNATYTVTYYVNGEVYGEVEEYVFKAALVLRENVATNPGYVFSGWEYTATSGIIQDMEIHGFITAIGYEITYHLNGGVNDSTNPIVYYVTDGEILLKDATKAGAIFKGWYTSEDYTTKVEKLSPDQLGDMELYALFEGGETDDGGCGSVMGAGVGTLTLVGTAILLKKKRKDTDEK